MPHDPLPPGGRRETRRQFLKRTGTFTAAIASAPALHVSAQAATTRATASIVLEADEELTKAASVRWATQALNDALTENAVTVSTAERLEQSPANQECILITGRRRFMELGGPRLSEAPESFGLARIAGQKPVVLVAGADARGLVYGLLELVDQLKNSADPIAALRSIQATVESPVNPIRSLGRLFASDVEDKPWFNSREFWQRYLSMAATHRFNRVNLTFGLAYDFTRDITDCYFHFAYPFLLAVPGYNVRAVPLPDTERDANLEMLRFASDEAALRGLQFQLGLWTHAYQWTDSPRANYTITGLTPETQATYSRDALKMLLQQCPNITGVTIRTHGESGVSEGNTAIWQTVFQGVADSGRRVEIDLHAKGITPGIIDAALATGMPVNISPKFWAEHMGLPYMQGAIRPQEMPPRNANDRGFFARSTGSRSFLRYGYGDLLAEARRYGVLHRIWPGTQRVLLWGDPAMAAAYGRAGSFCGSNGIELFEPLSFKGRKGSGHAGGREAYADPTLKPEFDFEKYDYSYRIWGRNLFNPTTDPDGWQRSLRKQFSRGADHAEAALAAAGSILPLVTTAHCPSAANNLYWPEMYWNLQMTESGHRHPYSDTPNPKRFGNVSPLDPEFFLSCDDYAGELLSGEPSGKYSPAWVAARLEDHAAQAATALRSLAGATRRSVEYRRLQIDVALQTGLGRFFAAKFRAGVCYGIYLRTKSPAALWEALRESRTSRTVWAELARLAQGVYREDVSYGPDYYQRGHWHDRLPALDADIADLEKLSANSGKAELTPEALDAAAAALQRARLAVGQTTRGAGSLIHVPAASFRRGTAVNAVAYQNHTREEVALASVQLRYRRVNQAETWQTMAMTRSGEEYAASIPAAYADSPFPVQYHFQVREAGGRTWLYPGLEHPWNGQPYFVVRQG